MDIIKDSILKSGDIVTIQADNGKYLTLLPSNGVLKFTGDGINSNNRFIVTLLPNNKLALLAIGNNKYLSRYNGENIQAVKNPIDGFCYFRAHVLPDSKIELQAENDIYLSRIDDNIKAAKPTPDLFCQFKMSIISSIDIKPLIVFQAGGITDQQLEPNEGTYYQFNVKNVSSMIFSNIIIAIDYDKDRFRNNGVTIEVGIGASGKPELTVPGPLMPGDSKLVQFQLTTINAQPQNYTFDLSLLSINIKESENSDFAWDSEHKFTVVSS
jgi:hypothetical protein